MKSLTLRVYINDQYPMEIIRATDRVSGKNSIGNMSDSTSKWRSGLNAKRYFSLKRECLGIVQRRFRSGTLEQR